MDLYFLRHASYNNELKREVLGVKQKREILLRGDGSKQKGWREALFVANKNKSFILLD